MGSPLALSVTTISVPSQDRHYHRCAVVIARQYLTQNSQLNKVNR
jgi:hypothetical protein